MPEDFLRCVRDGGKVWTETLGKGRYRRVCTLNGKTYFDHVKTKKNRGANPAEAITRQR